MVTLGQWNMGILRAHLLRNLLTGPSSRSGRGRHRKGAKRNRNRCRGGGFELGGPESGCKGQFLTRVDDALSRGYDDRRDGEGVAALGETGFELPSEPSFTIVEDTAMGTSIAVPPVVG